MPQIFHVLRCFSCSTFQVHQVKKSNKYNCKLCSVKQSVTKVYGDGSGAECRKMVQQLNMYQGEKQAAIERFVINHDEGGDGNCGPAAFIAPSQNNNLASAGGTQTLGPQNSKWDKYDTEEREEVIMGTTADEENPNFTTSWTDFAGSKAGKSRRGQRHKPYSRQNDRLHSSNNGTQYENQSNSVPQQPTPNKTSSTRQVSSDRNDWSEATSTSSRYNQQLRPVKTFETQTSALKYQNKVNNIQNGRLGNNSVDKFGGLVVSSSDKAHNVAYDKNGLPQKQNFATSQNFGEANSRHLNQNKSSAVKTISKRSIPSSSKWSKYASIVKEDSCSSDEDLEENNLFPFSNKVFGPSSTDTLQAPNDKESGPYTSCPIDKETDPYASSQESLDHVLETNEKSVEKGTSCRSRVTSDGKRTQGSEANSCFISGGSNSRAIGHKGVDLIASSKWNKYIDIVPESKEDESEDDDENFGSNLSSVFGSITGSSNPVQTHDKLNHGAICGNDKTGSVTGGESFQPSLGHSNPQQKHDKNISKSALSGMINDSVTGRKGFQPSLDPTRCPPVCIKMDKNSNKLNNAMEKNSIWQKTLPKSQGVNTPFSNSVFGDLDDDELNQILDEF